MPKAYLGPEALMFGCLDICISANGSFVPCSVHQTRIIYFGSITIAEILRRFCGVYDTYILRTLSVPLRGIRTEETLPLGVYNTLAEKAYGLGSRV